MSDNTQWQMRIEGGLSAHFNQPDGSSRPGTDWAVGLLKGQEHTRVMVRAYLSDDLTAEARADTGYQGRTVLTYMSDLLAQGWTPERGGDLVITIQNPSPGQLTPKAKPWWKFW